MDIAISIGIILGTVALLVPLIKWHSINYEYECPECGRKFRISPMKNFISPHLFTITYTKCSHCSKLSWCKIFKIK